VTRSGVTYNEQLEWVLAAIWANHTPQSFRELEGAEQAEILAAYETNIQIEAVIATENQRKNNQKQPKRGKHG
jgi:hypothetical protein